MQTVSSTSTKLGGAPQGDPALELLFEKCLVLADLVDRRELSFLDAVDIAWDSAVFGGTCARVGPDLVQWVLSRAFMGTPKSGGIA
jgi:hypothetical protein